MGGPDVVARSDRAQASCVEGQEFQFWANQTDGLFYLMLVTTEHGH